MRRVLFVAAGLLAVLAAGVLPVALMAAPAGAHEHPSGLTDLVVPALVRIEATSRVEITLLDHSEDLRQVKRSYDVPIGEGSGAIVTPEGVMITLSEVVRPDKDPAVYAVNRIFAEHYEVEIPEDFERHTVKGGLNGRLQDCYASENGGGTCIIETSTEVVAHPNLTSPEKEGRPAEIVHAGKKAAEPAIVALTGRTGDGPDVPTAPLAGEVPRKEGSPVSVAGFTGEPAADLRHTVEIAHLSAPGQKGRSFEDPEDKVDESAKLGELTGKGLRGGPVIGDKDGKIIGLLGGEDSPRLVGAREIAATLDKAKVTPRRGGIDDAFEVALAHLHNKFYGNAVPAFDRVLELFPGHVVAAAHRKTAIQKRGGPEDAGVRPEPAGSGADTLSLPLVGAGIGLAVLLMAGVVLGWRREGLRSALGRLRPRAAAEPAGLPSPAEPTNMVRPAVSGPIQVREERGSMGTAIRKYCTECGMRLGHAHRFCGYCGHPVEM